MTIDWTVPAKLIERQDGGSEMFYEFRELRTDILSTLVVDVLAKPADERARLLIDAGVAGTFNIADIVSLARRNDFPS